MSKPIMFRRDLLKGAVGAAGLSTVGLPAARAKSVPKSSASTPP